MKLAPATSQFDLLEDVFNTIFVEEPTREEVGFLIEDWKKVVIYPDKHVLGADHLAGLRKALIDVAQPELFFFYREGEGTVEARFRGMYSFDNYDEYVEEPPPHAINSIFSPAANWAVHFSAFGTLAAGWPDLIERWEASFDDTWCEQEKKFIEGAVRLFADVPASMAAVEDVVGVVHGESEAKKRLTMAQRKLADRPRPVTDETEQFDPAS